MFKVKHERTADCVVAGFRWHKDGGGVGSLLLGLFDDEGRPAPPGVASGFSVARGRSSKTCSSPSRARRRQPSVARRGRAHHAHAPAKSEPVERREDLDWEPLRAELVAEVAYDHLQGDRFRHATSFVRWRRDRTVTSCRYDQLEAPVPTELQEIFE